MACAGKKKKKAKNLNMSNAVEYASRNYMYALQSYAIFSVLHYKSCNLKQALSKWDRLI